jgi:hypothetical protein
MDFTLHTYQKLLETFQEKNFSFDLVSNYPKDLKNKKIFLRHDVDDLKLNSLKFAQIQHKMGIVGTYYFRMVPESFDKDVILEIANMGHEIGYHYEDMDFANGDPEKALAYFKNHLKTLREITPITSICMHGSPRSKFDNKAIWNHYNYKDFGIDIEPYFDFDFNKVFYLTDTGRRWDGFKVSVRDKVQTTKKWPEYNSTDQIIKSIQENKFPPIALFNFHPQRWTNNKYIWVSEFVRQNIKNKIKQYLFVTKNKSQA